MSYEKPNESLGNPDRFGSAGSRRDRAECHRNRKHWPGDHTNDMSVTHNTPQVTQAYRKLEKKFAFATRKAASRGGRVLRDSIREFVPPPRGAGSFPGYAAKGTLRRAIVDTEPVQRPRANDWQVSVLVNESSPARVYAHIHNVGGVIRAKNAPYLKFKIGNQWIQVKSVRIRRKSYMAQGVKLARERMKPAIRDAFIREIR